MTCVIGMVHQGKVYIGADSLGTNGWNGITLSNRKVFHVGEFLIGSAGSVRMLQLLQYQLRVRQQEENETDEHYIIVGFVDALRQCLKDHGFATVDNSKEFSYQNFLLGYRGQLYVIEGEYNVCIHADGIASIGAGDEYGLGAITAFLESASNPDDLNVENIILRSLAISAKFNRSVSAPFCVEKLG